MHGVLSASNDFGKFDYVLANPPFNVDEVSLWAVEKKTHAFQRTLLALVAVPHR